MSSAQAAEPTKADVTEEAADGTKSDAQANTALAAAQEEEQAEEEEPHRNKKGRALPMPARRRAEQAVTEQAELHAPEQVEHPLPEQDEAREGTPPQPAPRRGGRTKARAQPVAATPMASVQDLAVPEPAVPAQEEEEAREGTLSVPPPRRGGRTKARAQPVAATPAARPAAPVLPPRTTRRMAAAMRSTTRHVNSE